jgi:hypothetical protein
MNSPFPPPAPGPVPPPPGVPPAPSGRGGGAKGCLLAGGLVGLVLLAVVAFGIVKLVGFVQDQQATHVDAAKVGDCVRDTPDDTSSKVRITPCEKAEATDKVLGLQGSGSNEDCIDVAGATRQVSNEDGRVCLGKKDVDPARSANAAQVGDCLAVAGNEAETVPCDDPSATHTVLKREKNSSITGGMGELSCRSVDGAESSYSITWDGDALSRLSSKGLTYCLGPVE